MAIKVKQARDLSTNEIIYFKGHAQATYLSDGTTVEDAINGISGESSGSIDTSNLATKEELATKQDVISDIDTIRSDAAKGATALQSVPSEYVTETELSNKGYATISALNNKVDVINGKQLSTEDFTTALKTKLEELNNYDDTELSNAIETLREDFDNIVSGDTTTAIKTFNEVIAFLDGLTDTQDLESIIASIEQQIASKSDDSLVLHKAGNETITGIKTFNGRVNFLGSGDSNAMYLSTNTRLNVNGTTNTVLGFSSGTFLINNAAYDLTLRGKGTRPTYNSTTLALSSDIPTAITESTVSGWGFTKNTGTITGVSANGTSVATSGVANIPAASTSVYGVTKLSSATNSTSTVLAATASAVKAAYDLADSKQAALVSGTNIKTINGNSILGSGDITITGGSSSGSAYSEVSHGTADTTFELTPNTFHVWDEVTELDLSLGAETAGVANEYLFQFTSGSTATTLSLPDDIKWANDEVPVIEANKIYQISILKGLGNALIFNIPLIITFTIEGTPYQAEDGMTWENWVNSKYNIDGATLYGNYISLSGTINFNGAYVKSTDYIVNNRAYKNTISSGGGA